MKIKNRELEPLHTGKGTSYTVVPLPDQGYVQLRVEYASHEVYGLLEPSELDKLIVLLTEAKRRVLE